jgi:hypothetical protein
MRRFVALLISVSFLLTALAGCSAPAPACVPRMTVTPSPAHPGDTITLESSDVCEVTVPRDGWRIVVNPPGDSGPRIAATTSKTFDGSFSATVTLPHDIAPGDALAGVENWDYSTCDDRASCVGPFGDFTIVAP